MRHWISIALLLTASALSAQTTGQISGKITDKATKQPLPDAVVAIVGTKQGAITDAAGHFLISGVEVSFIGSS